MYRVKQIERQVVVFHEGVIRSRRQYPPIRLLLLLVPGERKGKERGGEKREEGKKEKRRGRKREEREEGNDTGENSGHDTGETAWHR